CMFSEIKRTNRSQKAAGIADRPQQFSLFDRLFDEWLYHIGIFAMPRHSADQYERIIFFGYAFQIVIRQNGKASDRFYGFLRKRNNFVFKLSAAYHRNGGGQIGRFKVRPLIEQKV